MKVEHSLLRRQLRQHFGDDHEVPRDFRPLIERIEQAYHAFDQDRRMLERSLDLSSQELMEANDAMLEAEQEKQMAMAVRLEALGVMAGGIAHDFNNMLAVMMGNLALAIDDIDKHSQVSELLHDCQRAVEQARGLTRQLLTFARGGDPVTERASVENLLRESTRFALRGSNVRARFDFADDLPDVEIDPSQMAQVVQNLVINADQAMPGGGVLKVRAYPTAPTCGGANVMGPLPPGDYVQVEITDTGTGIAPTHLKHVFEPYFTTKQQGSGLGLATSYAIVRKHGGAMTVRSELGKGTSFCLCLPASKRPAAMPEEQGPTESPPLRVLVMDDDAALLRVAARICAHLGHVVEVAADGEAALALCRRARDEDRPFDLVIADLTVPAGMGGKALVAAMRAEFAETRVVASSGYSEDLSLADADAFGFDAVLPKPYNLDQVRKAITTALDAPRAIPAVHEPMTAEPRLADR